MRSSRLALPPPLATWLRKAIAVPPRGLKAVVPLTGTSGRCRGAIAVIAVGRRRRRAPRTRCSSAGRGPCGWRPCRRAGRPRVRRLSRRLVDHVHALGRREAPLAQGDRVAAVDPHAVAREHLALEQLERGVAIDGGVKVEVRAGIADPGEGAAALPPSTAAGWPPTRSCRRRARSGRRSWRRSGRGSGCRARRRCRACRPRRCRSA